VLAALVASGLPAAPFTFVGFLPRRAGERARRLAALAPRSETLVFFESPRRVGRLLGELAVAFGERRACLARELTKLHEELARGTLPELAARFSEGARGELTLVVAGAAAADERAAATPEAALRERVRALLGSGVSARDLARQLAEETGAPRRTLYALAVEESGQ
jgi:16S rRNA (cytidine1402-2'-O)-methyltransferase